MASSGKNAVKNSLACFWAAYSGKNNSSTGIKISIFSDIYFNSLFYKSWGYFLHPAYPQIGHFSTSCYTPAAIFHRRNGVMLFMHIRWQLLLPLLMPLLACNSV